MGTLAPMSPTPTSWTVDKLTKLFGDDRRAAQIANRVNNLLQWTPLGVPQAAYDAGQMMGSGARVAQEGSLLGGGLKAGAGLGMAVLSMIPGARGATGKTKALLMDEASRMARAKDQGFVIDAYKGAYPYDASKGPVSGFKNGKFQEIENIGAVPPELTHFERDKSMAVPGPHAGFFASHPAVSNRFAEALGASYPVKLKMQNPLVFDAGGKHAAAFQFDESAKRNGTLKELDQFRRVFTEENDYDGVILKNTLDEGTVYIPKTPQQARSRFAAFDPAKLNSKDLLAAVPVGVGSAATLSQLLAQPQQQRDY